MPDYNFYSLFFAVFVSCLIFFSVATGIFFTNPELHSGFVKKTKKFFIPLQHDTKENN